MDIAHGGVARVSLRDESPWQLQRYRNEEVRLKPALWPAPSLGLEGVKSFNVVADGGTTRTMSCYGGYPASSGSLITPSRTVSEMPHRSYDLDQIATGQ